MVTNKKVLCFTTSYKRQKFLRGTIQDIINQSYNNITHTINCTFDNINETIFNDKLFDDLISDRVNIIYTENGHQHYNYINSIISVKNYEDYDLFVKIDDDDIYKKKYVETIVNEFNLDKNLDVVSSKIKYQLNNTKVFEGYYTDLGGNPRCHFNMPPTFAFNKKALDFILNLESIYGFEDHMWRDAWCGKTKIKEIKNSENIIWHIHGKNISTSDFLIKQ